MRNRIMLCEIAGFCPEEAVWKMLCDISQFLQRAGAAYPIDAASIIVDGESFLVEGNKTSADMSEAIWELGAAAYYAATGHIVFGGHGRDYQLSNPQVALPVLPKGFQSMTPVIQQCLCNNPQERIHIENLVTEASKGLDGCRDRQRTKVDKQSKPEQAKQEHSDKWPEEMIET